MTHLRFRRRLPFQQPLPRHHPPHQRSHHRINRQKHLVRQQRQRKQNRQIRLDQISHRVARHSKIPRDHRSRQSKQQFHPFRHEHDADRRHRPPDGMPHPEPAKQEQHERRRFYQAPTQIVQNLPARYQRDRIPYRRARLIRHLVRKPLHDLPVPAQPAMFPPVVRAVVRGIILDHRNVAHQPSARIRPLNQVMTKQRVPRESSIQHVQQRIDLVDPFAGKRPLSIQILVHIGTRPRVRIQPGLTNEDCGQPRSRGAVHADIDPRLQDPVSRHHDVVLRIDDRLI